MIPTLRMLDSIHPENLPAGADAYLAYVDGNWPTYPAVLEKFPAARVLSMAVFPWDDAEGCDCETGDLRADQVPDWVVRQQARGVIRPVVYASASLMPLIVSLLQSAGIQRSRYRLLSAHYGDGKHICGPATCAVRDAQGRVVPQCDGTQWTDRAAGANGTLIDESVLSGSFFTTLHRARKLEEPVLLNKGSGARTPIALPDGTTKVRFFASQPAQIRVDLRNAKQPLTLDLDYPSAHAVDIPSDVHGIVVHRVDTADSDVSAVSFS